jgi:hypothetical protein
MPPTQNAEETDCERNQKFNSLVSWIHSYRYKNLLILFEGLACKAEGQSMVGADDKTQYDTSGYSKISMWVLASDVCVFCVHSCGAEEMIAPNTALLIVLKVMWV